MKVAFALDGFPKTTETFIQNQAIGLLSKGVDVRVFAESKSDLEVTHSAITEYQMENRVTYTADPQSYRDGFNLLCESIPHLLREKNVPLQVILEGIVSGTSGPRKLSNLKTVVQSEPADLYHAHFGPVGNRFLGITGCFDTPFVVSFYGWDASQLLRDNPHIYDKLFTRADIVTALSEDMRSTLVDHGCPPSKVHIQPLSIDTDLFPYRERTLTDGPVQILSVARFVEKKGLVYAIEAVAALADEHDVQYTIIGDGDRRDLIETKIAEYDLEDTVELLGWQPQSVVADEMEDAHLFMLPSVTAKSGDKEGTPTVLLEAQSMGLPVVSTYHAGIPEIVEDGETGILVPERDSDALVDALEALLSEPDRWSEMGKRGRDHIEQNHSIEAVTDDLLELYRSLL